MIPDLLLADDYEAGRTYIVRLSPLLLVEILDDYAEGSHFDGEYYYLPLIGEPSGFDMAAIVRFHADQNAALERSDETPKLLSELAAQFGVHADNLRQAVLRGSLVAQKKGRNWYTTARLVAEYLDR